MRKLVSILLVVAGLALLWLAGSRHDNIIPIREAATPGDVSAPDNMPPQVAFITVALGGFRGLIADALWLRASRMQEEGRIFELVQLSDWITKLEPRFAQVWAFHGWNMAYNVSVMLDDPADRWRWVSHGIELLRDRGLFYNPGDGDLYRELAWIFFHKIGWDLDQAHHYYKTALATEMMGILGGPTPDYEAFKNIPHSEEEFVKQANVSALLESIRELGLDPLSVKTYEASGMDDSLKEALASNPAGPLWNTYMQRKALRTKHKLDPEVMQTIDERFGPLDWRMPYSFSIYWAYRGMAHAEGFVKLQLDRTISQSIAHAFKFGACAFDLDGNVIPSPQPHLIDRVKNIYETTIATHPDTDSFKSGYKFFLADAVLTLYFHNYLKEAGEAFETLSQLFPEMAKNLPMERWVVREFIDTRINNYSLENISSLLEGIILQKWLRYAIGDERKATGFHVLSQAVYREYMIRLKDAEHKDRVGLPPIKEIDKKAYNRVVEQLNLFQKEKSQKRLRELGPTPTFFKDGNGVPSKDQEAPS